MKVDARIDAAIEFLQRQADPDITVRQIAAGAGLSPSRFSHLFALTTGMTPAKYLRRIKLVQKEARLVDTTFTPADLARPSKQKLRSIPRQTNYIS